MSSRNTDKNWQESAEYQQKQFANNLNVIDVSTYDVLLNRISVTLFGLPKTDVMKFTEEFSSSYYTIDQQKTTKALAQCILENQKKTNKNKVYCGLVCIYGRTTGSKQNFEEWIYRIPGKENIIFIDRNCRVYKNWNDYLKTNILPKATICYPENGEYTNNTLQKVKFMKSPACSVKNDVVLGVDITTVVTGLAAGGVCTAALFVPIIAPVVWSAVGVSVASGLWSAGRSIEHLVDRSQHEQTLSFLDTQARSAWLGATIPFLGMAAGGASAAVAVSASRAGVAVSQAARIAVNVTTGINCAAQATYVIHDIYSIIETKMNGNKITIMQIFQLVTSSLLFANAVVSAYQASLLLQNMAAKDFNDGIYTKLSNSQATENGIKIRPTNVLTTANISSMISIAIPYGCLLLKIPPTICSTIHEIITYILKNRKAEMTSVFVGLLPHFKILWQKIDDHVNKRYYDNQWNDEFYRSSKKEETETHSYSTHTNKTKGVDIKDKCNDNDITIIDIDWEGQKEIVQEAINQVFYKEKVSKLDILEFYRFFIGIIRGEVAEKEQEFQNMLKQLPNTNEETLNKIYNIKGDRMQFFADKVMRTYKGVKLSAMKLNYMKMVEKEGLQVPLFNGSACQFDIIYYTSIQKKGNQREKFLKILQQANVHFPPNLSTVYCADNFYCVEIHDHKSKYEMAGVVNFGDTNNMTGFIIIENKHF